MQHAGFPHEGLGNGVQLRNMRTGVVRAVDAERALYRRLAWADSVPAFAVLRGYGLEGDDLIDATRAVRSAVHGFVTLEIAGGFGLPQDVDRSFDRLVEMVDKGLLNRIAAPAAELRS